MVWSIVPEIPLGIWRHFKGGYYEVLVVAVNARTAEQSVVYRNPDNPRWVWTRTAEDFLEKVEHYAGAMVPRFIYVRSTDTPTFSPR